ncbi:MAG: hypothetical protein U0359_13350 [Byssovorax sp.]
MSEPDEPTFSVTLLSLAKSTDHAGLCRAVGEVLHRSATEARALVERLPAHIVRGADRATTEKLVKQVLGLGAELCVTNDRTGVEKLYYPGTGHADDLHLPSDPPAAPSGRKRTDTGSSGGRPADAGASMRDALRMARQRAQAADGVPISSRDGSPVSARHSSDPGPGSGPTSGRAPAASPVSHPPPSPLELALDPHPSVPPISHPSVPPISHPSVPPISHPPSHSNPPPASQPPHSNPPPADPSGAAKPVRAVHHKHDTRADDAAADRRKLLRRMAVGLGLVVALGAAGFVASSLGPRSLALQVGEQTWKAKIPAGAVEGESFSTSLVTELGSARMDVKTAQGQGAVQRCALAHMTFSSLPKLDGAKIDAALQHALDDLAPGGKLGPGEAATMGKLQGRQAVFSGPNGGAPRGKAQAFIVHEGELGVLLVSGGSGVESSPEARAFFDSASLPE